MHWKKRLGLLGMALLIAGLMGCGKNPNVAAPDDGADNSSSNASYNLTILAGSENKTLQPLIDRFAHDNNVQIHMDFSGSVDIMMMLQSGQVNYDAIWPANSLWIALGDKQHLVRDEQSVLWSPVVLGVKKSVAQRLGWVGKKEVTVEDILSASESGKLKFMMTSATQSNSGASAYLGYLSAFAGRPQVLTAANLDSPELRAKIKRILGQVNRSSGSSGWLKDLFLQKYADYDAMVNYESVVIEANQALVAQGKEPLYVIYPADGLAIADSPLAYVDKKDDNKSRLFHKLQEWLLSPAVQQELLQQGRRVGPVGMELKNADKAVFNPDWGINLDRFLNPIRYPKADVIQKALDLYQTAFRKPSYTIFCLDYSGSMKGDREAGLKKAMQMILDQDQARRSLLQASSGDITTVITFSSHILNEWTVNGSDPGELRKLWENVNSSEPEGGTDIYSPVIRALDEMKSRSDLKNYFPAVILMTDGESNEGATFSDLQAHLGQMGPGTDIPVFSIQFGEASGDQLKAIGDATAGRVFDGKVDLTKAFREAKGYN